ncbi:chitinase domain-containing protein 1-like [Neltuma alba]|uniref:chitinase domain-containing protein 1-like n=1 Tax=Neltuma alba TaxID=207710 RepID=UPI0010A50FB7|nr:chitinase domain-containing protein 1-like [Prosopis alba]
MAKKRERRSAPGSANRDNQAESSTRRDNRGELASGRKLVPFLVLFFIASSIISVIVYRFKYSPTRSRESDAHQQDVMKADLSYQAVLTENSKVENTSRRHYGYPVLGYITPWNSKGYELAKRFNSKFTHLSPVWYELKSQQAGLVLEGRHNADIGWISELKNIGHALILPRVVLEASPLELLTKKKQRNRAINLIVTECKEMGYDGIVLESWSRWAAYGILHEPSMRNLALHFIKQLGEALHSVSGKDNGQQLQLIYVMGPPSSKKLQEHDFGPNDLEILSEVVDGFSLMTYDFSSPHNPGPNAPLKWIQFTLSLLLGTPGHRAQSLANKILLGINFYGNDFSLSRGSGGRAILGRDYLSLLEKHRPVLQWDENSGERFFFYIDDEDGKRVVFYPSLKSISLRLEEARLWGCGISIWEIGQGLDYFFDLL